MASAAAGWYPDPEREHTQRYWDGSSWTEDRAPGVAHASPPPGPAATSAQPSAALEAFGVLMAIFIPIVGLLVGLALVGKSKAATSILVISVISFVVYALILTGS